MAPRDERTKENSEQGQGWTQYQKLVLSELERHDDRQGALEKELIDLK